MKVGNTLSEIEKNETNEEVTEEIEATETEESSELEELQEKYAALEDQSYRLQAEIQNMQKRQRREIADQRKYRAQSLAEKMIPALDNLEQVLAMEVTTSGEENLQKGVELVYKNILQAFADENITVVDPAGETFDPNFHEAVSMVASTDEVASGDITQVFQKGYQLDDRVIRAAKVVVAQ